MPYRFGCNGCNLAPVEGVHRIPVHIALERGQKPLHLLRPGLSVEPTVNVREWAWGRAHSSLRFAFVWTHAAAASTNVRGYRTGLDNFCGLAYIEDR